jgi:hypothetical protein
MAHPCSTSNPITHTSCAFDGSCNCVSCSCSRYVCPKPCSTLARIQRRVRIPMTLYTARQSAFNISGFGVNSRGTDDNPNAVDSFSGPSDRAAPSFNTITGKRGVDKKHNSYARYLGRKKAPVLRADMQYGGNIGGCFGAMCCCICEQVIKTHDTGNIDLQHAQVGDIVTQVNGQWIAEGVIIAIERNSGIAQDLDRIIIKVKDCASSPFLSFTDPTNNRLIIGGVPTSLPFTVITTNTCGGTPGVPRRR